MVVSKKVSAISANKIPYESRPELFYATCLANKRSPLRLVWIAAHWEKKIYKSQIYETNIKTLVDDIRRYRGKISIRISGHLLFGIVKIYCRKVKYLLADCEEVLSAVKLGFIGEKLINLSVSDKNKKKNVTLEQKFGFLEDGLDFDFLSGPNAVFNMDMTANQSRKEDITLREPNCPMISSFMLDDNFGFGNMTDILNDLQHLPTIVEEERIDQVISDNGMNIHKNVTCLPDSQIYESSRPSKRRPDEIDHRERSIEKKAKIDASLGEVGRVDILERNANEVERIDFILDKHIIKDRVIRPTKKRKLIIDSTSILSKTLLINHMTNTSTILLAGLEMAPPTKKMMMILEVGLVPQILQLPCHHLAHPRLLQLYKRNMVLTIKDADDDDDDHNKVGDIEVVRREADERKESNIANISIENDVIINGELVPIDEMVQDPAIDQLDMNGDMPRNDYLDKTPKGNVKDKKNKSQPIDLYGSKDNVHALPTPPELIASPSCCRFNVYDPFSPNVTKTDVVTSPLKPKVSESVTKSKLTNFFKDTLRAKNAITFADALKNLSIHNRKEASILFYTILELKKNEYINVNQQLPFSDIDVSKGSNFKNMPSVYGT